MFTFICKKLLRPNPRFPDASPPRLLQPHIDRNTPTAAGHYFSTESDNEDGGKGLLCCPPLDNTKSSSVVVGSAADKVEVTKTLFKDYGFTDTQISQLYIKRPNIFNCVDPDKTLLPKLDFFRGTIGFSNTDLPRLICSNPSLLTLSLQNQIVPVYNFLKGLLLSDNDDSDDDETVLETVKRGGCRLFSYSMRKKMAHSISELTEAGVPLKYILRLLHYNPTVLVYSSIGESIKRATEMGLDPNKSSFVEAIRMFTQMSESTWDKKMEVYRKCGFSDAEILKAFRMHPVWMSRSERKIVQTMDFFVNEMGWHPDYLARNPTLLNFSLEKRIIPRCTVVNYLQAKRLLLPRKNISFSKSLQIKEKDFVDKFVNKYTIDAPDLMDIYLSKKCTPHSNTS